jgi:hypothetical protein
LITSNENAAESIELCRVFLFELFESMISALAFQHLLNPARADSAEVQAAASHLFPASNDYKGDGVRTAGTSSGLAIIFLGNKPG